MTAPYVLVVEDDEWLAEQHVRVLEAAGYAAQSVPHGLAAMDAIDSMQPQAIILDVLLAGPNAFTLLHELRSHVDLAAIPVILCTNSADSLIDEDVRVYGIKRILDKSTMVPADLVAAVKKVLL